MRSRWQYTPTMDHVEAVPDTGRPLEAPACSTGQPVVKPPIDKAPDKIDKTKDPRWQQLMALIGQLPPEKAEKLRQMLGSDGPAMAGTEALGQVLKALELRRGDDEPKPAGEPLMRRICQLLEPFLVDDDRDVGAGTIRRSSLVPWWQAAMAQSPVLVELDAQYQRAVAKRLTAEMERLEDEAMAELSRRARTLTIRNTAQSIIEDARRIGAILGGGLALAQALKDLGVDGPPGGPGIELSDWIIRRFGRAYQALGAERAFDPVWLGHAVMNHLARPWDAVSLIHKVAGTTDVQMLEQTELAPLMGRVMDQLVAVAAEAVARVKAAIKHQTAAEIAAANASATLYFDLAEAIAREVKLEKTSAWGRAYMASRKSLSDLIAETIDQFGEIIVGFVDDWSPESSGAEDAPAFLSAAAAGDFIGAMRLRATRHGFGMPFTTLERVMQECLGRVMPRARGNAPDPWPVQKRRLLTGMHLI